MKFAYKPGMMLFVQGQAYEIVNAAKHAATPEGKMWISLMEVKSSTIERLRVVSTDGLELDDISFILGITLAVTDVLDYQGRQVFSEPLYSIGDKFEIKHSTNAFPKGNYILCAVDNERITLINLETGNRFCNPIVWEGSNSSIPYSIIKNEILKDGTSNKYSFKRID